MRITAVESLYWREIPRVLTVRIHTDSGVCGWGKR